MSPLQRNLLTVAFLVVSINILTGMTISNNSILHVAMSDFDARERLNSGTTVIFRDEVVGVTYGENLNSFSSRQIAEMMDLFVSRRMAREAMYRPQLIRPEEVDHEPYEISVAISHRPRFILFSEITISAFQNGFKVEKTEHVFWFFRWHRMRDPVFRES